MDRGESVACSMLEPHPVDRNQRREMSKQAMREEAERLVREAMAKKTVTVTQGKTRIETKCGKCGAPNRVSVEPGQTRVTFSCKECDHKQTTL
jgi:transposase-like protein